MSGIINQIGAKSGEIKIQDIETVTVYHTPTQANSANTDAYVTFDGVRSYTADYQKWFSFSGADITLQPGVYHLHFQFTIDYFGQNGYHHKMWGRTSGASSPGKKISEAYGTMYSTHGEFPPKMHILTVLDPAIIKMSTRDTGDGHSLYDGTSGGGGSIQSPYTFLTILRFSHSLNYLHDTL